MRGKACYSLGNLANRISADCKGDSHCQINGIASLPEAQVGQISFLSDPTYASLLSSSKASAVIVSNEYANQIDNALISNNPYLGYAKISQIFDNRPQLNAGVHPSAVIAENASVAESAAIGPHAVIEPGVHVGERVEVGAGTYIGADTYLGNDTLIAANVTIHHCVTIGERVIIHSGTVIGADGFGFANSDDGWDKIAQLGGVRIGDSVEIGASTTIDRGALGDTVIANGVKIDNQVMIAHNVKIGAHTAIAGCVGIAGSAEIGSHCTLAGGVGLVGHIKITDRVHVTAMSLVTKSIDQSGSYSSGTAMMPTAQWKKNSVRARKLGELASRVNELEQQLRELKSNYK